MSAMPYPWQDSLWRRVLRQWREDRLPHALLLAGPSGLGKRHFAEAMAKSLLCEKTADDGLACGICHSCRLFESGAHPDYSDLGPEAPGKAIRIDEVRRLIEFIGLTRGLGKYKIGLIESAEALNAAAANALLKTLEEPPEGALLLLVSNRPGTLPATVRSRCQALPFSRPAAEKSQSWLEGELEPAQKPLAALLLSRAGGAPLAALELGDAQRIGREEAWLDELSRAHFDAGELADRMMGTDPAQALDVYVALLRDLVRCVLGAPLREIPSRTRELQALSGGVHLQVVFACLDQAERLRTQLSKGLNMALQMEELLRRYQAAVASA